MSGPSVVRPLNGREDRQTPVRVAPRNSILDGRSSCPFRGSRSTQTQNTAEADGRRVHANLAYAPHFLEAAGMRWRMVIGLPLLLAAAPEPPNELLQAVRTERTTWLLRENGRLFRLDDGATVPIAVTIPARASGICVVRGALALIGRSKAGWQVFRRNGNNWQGGLSTPVLPSERYVGSACATDGATVLTDRRLIDQRRGIVPLVEYKPVMSIRTVVYREPEALLVATNAGKWGGKLLRIPLANGRVEEVPGTGAPIHDIAPAPGKPGCVVLAVGLVHFFPSGKLTELCGSRTRRLYARAWEEQGFKARAEQPDKDPYPSVAFYGLAPATDGSLRAIAMDGLYRIARDGNVSGPEPLPVFVPKGDVRISKADTAFELVLTGVNGRASLGGAMPIVVQR